jgi:hypothetical protein
MVTNSRLPVLWLCGAPATGKSTVAWQVFSDFADQELCVGYLDIDQIGMLQPPQDGDPQGHRFKVDAAPAEWPVEVAPPPTSAPKSTVASTSFRP